MGPMIRSRLLLFLLPTALGCADILGFGEETTSAGGSGGGGTTATGGATTAGGGGAGGTTSTGECTDGDQEPCYDGPPGTEGIGICQAGTRACDASGRWGACEGQVGPGYEKCKTAADDENCDHIAECTGQFRWGRAFGSPQAETLAAVAADAQGNVYFAGTTAGAIDLGQGPLPFAGGTDMLLVKLDPEGKVAWAKTFGGAGNDGLRAVAVDPAGNVIVAGGIGGGDVDLGCGAVPYTSGVDAVVAKLDPGGACVWSKGLGGAGGQTVTAVAAGPAGEALVAGKYTAAFDVGPFPLTEAGDGLGDVLVARLSADKGDPEWVKGFGSPGVDVATGIAATTTGDVVVTATVTNLFDLGGSILPAGGGKDAVIGKLAAATGAHVWSMRYGDTLDQETSAVAVFPGGRSVFALRVRGKVNLGGAMIDGPVDGTSDVAVVSLAGNGQFQWARSAGAAASDQVATSVAADQDGQVLVAGSFAGSLNFTNQPANELAAVGANDLFLVKLDTAGGVFTWGKRFTNAVDGEASVAVDGLGRIAFAALLDGTTNLGGGPLSSAAPGDADILAGSFAP